MFKTVDSLSQNGKTASYVWSYIEMRPKFDNATWGPVYETGIIEVRQAIKGLQYPGGETIPNTLSVSLTYNQSNPYLYPIQATPSYAYNPGDLITANCTNVWVRYF